MPRSASDDVLLHLVRGIVGISTAAADQLGAVSVVQLRALTVLAASRGANLSQLAAGMGVAESTASKLVDRLVAAGFVDRGPSPRSRRELALAVAAAGEQTLRRYDDLRLDVLRSAVSRLPEGSRADVLDALAVFAEAVLPGVDAAEGTPGE